MKKVIMIKYGELSTKKDNIGYFLVTLKNNILETLKGYDCKVNYDKSRMFIETDNFKEVIDALKKVFGIHEIVIGYKIETKDIEEIGNEVLKLVKEKEFKTFKVVTKRSDKSYPLTSMEISKKIGAILLKNISNIRVDVHNPDLEINVEIRRNETLVYFERIKGSGGYPVFKTGLCLYQGVYAGSGGCAAGPGGD